MKYIFLLFFFVHFSVYSQKPKKYSIFLQAGINNSFFESKSNYKDNKLIFGPNLGLDVGCGINYKLTSKASLEFVTSISNRNFVIRSKEYNGFFLANFIPARFSTKYKRRITEKYALAIGADIDFLSTEDFELGFSEVAISIKGNNSPVHIPLAISLERNFTSKKNRKTAILFHVKKGFQLVDDYNVVIANDMDEKVTFNFKNSSVALTYRYFFGAKK